MEGIFAEEMEKVTAKRRIEDVPEISYFSPKNGKKKN